jgi:phosphomannomutase/phosphoglucomutase
VGNPSGQVKTTGLKFWAEHARPLSAGGPLEAIQARYVRGTDRPTRKSGPLARFRAEPLYLAGLEAHFHALRPLRFLVDTTCGPLVGYLEKLLRQVACEMILRRTTAEQLTEQIRREHAHFALLVDDDGERCRLWDESGRLVASERLLLLLARHLLAIQPSSPAVVLEETVPRPLAREIRALGVRVCFCAPRRAEVHQAVQEHHALLGGGPSGRFWYRDAENHASADALMTLTLLLGLLSQSDRPLSEVLDAAGSAQ